MRLEHENERRLRAMGELTASAVIEHMKRTYPAPMAHASGGFRKTLAATIAREVQRIGGMEIRA